MGHRFVTADREQGFLLPVDVRDWLPGDHLAWCLIEVAGQLDLARFRGRYRADGQGRPAFDPELMVALLLYCYCTGVRSSRAIEGACRTDVACRVITGNHVPDHATIARFRSRHQEALTGLLVQSLAVCAAAGMVKVGLVALDGTKVIADAAGAANRTAAGLAGLIAGLEEQVAAMLAEAAAADQAEDALWGARRGDELPAQLARAGGRLERLRAAKARVDAEQAARDAKAAKAAAYEQAAAAGKRPPGRPPKAAKPARTARTAREDQAASGDQAATPASGDGAASAPPEPKPPRANATDPDSRVMKTKNGFVQGYNAQVLAGGGQLILAAGAFSDPVDVQLLHPMLDRARENLAAARIADPMRVALADTGYASAANFTAARTPLLLVAVAKEGKQAGRAPGPVTVRKAHQPMAARLATPAGKHLYKRRSPMIEPVFAQLTARGGRRVRYRGLAAANAEIILWATAHNLLKYHTRATRPPHTP